MKTGASEKRSSVEKLNSRFKLGIYVGVWTTGIRKESEIDYQRGTGPQGPLAGLLDLS